MYKSKIRNNLVKYMKQINKSFPQPLLLTGSEKTVVQNNYGEQVVSEVKAESTLKHQSYNSFYVYYKYCG